ncbi:putative spindle pole body component [Neofusicoccum parvum]|uniref:Putative spindle pole body protein n=1 Tax=Botryosphaeria parva (strain UCR-NP2) TaxID=1287680 RepID=R1EFP2_BOTPV|nr:putative spindle pole body protein [Neofusicoccum parvum UCRNP2]GME47367.1 putative spindle pole body component [Neofusicoccum parvum]
MADQEEDFSSLPLPDRFQHKNWKVRKEGYEAAAKEFDKAQGETDPVVRQFILDNSLWKGAVADSNVAAQTEALGALCSFLQIAGTPGTTKTRNLTIQPIVEKGLTGRPAAQAKAQEALLLYIEMDRADPVIEELLPILSHKQPKVIAACLKSLTAIVHAYGCKTVEPKPILKALPKVFGHADKNVRAEAQNLTVEFYRWLKDAMKPLFWGDLKPVQQTDLDKLFEKVKDEPSPKQERLLRSQQEAQEAAAAAGGGDEAEEAGEEEAEIDLEPEFMAVDVMAKVPKDFSERLGSSKWKDRKEALDDLHTAINVPAMEEGPFDDIMRGLAKSMKDANVAVVTVAANCVELFAKGLKKKFSKYRSTVFSPMIERLKEKKQAVADALGAALEACVASSSLGECLEEILEALKHKNPQVKLGTTQLLIRVLKSTREAPSPPELKSIAEGATKLLTESQATQRDAGAEVLGTLWKIMGDRIMNPHLDGLDDIRKNKIKEFHDSAEVKAKYKPKAAAPPKPAPAPAVEKAELEELRAEVDMLRKQTEDLKAEKSRMTSQIHELQNQNAQLIEDHTRDVLSIKAKETQLVRARSDAEAAEQTVQAQQREVERLKRELSRQVRATSPPPFDISHEQQHGVYNDIGMNGGSYNHTNNHTSSYGHTSSFGRRNFTPQSPGGDGKENFGDGLSRSGSRSSKLSPLRRGGSGSGMSSHSGSGYGGRASPALGGADDREFGSMGSGRLSGAASVGTGNGAESWKRAAEVTQNLKARIELMKAKQGSFSLR